MKFSEYPAYSPDTDTHYPSWDDLLEAESSGYVMTAVLVQERESGPVVRTYTEGPFLTKEDAEKARRRFTTKEETSGPTTTVRCTVRPLWKDDKHAAAVEWLHKHLWHLSLKHSPADRATNPPEAWNETVQELERKGYDGLWHLAYMEKNSSWGWAPVFYDADGARKHPYRCAKCGREGASKFFEGPTLRFHKECRP